MLVGSAHPTRIILSPRKAFELDTIQPRRARRGDKGRGATTSSRRLLKGAIRIPFMLVSMHALAALALADAPSVQYLFPAGGQRGQTVEVTVAGTLAHWPAQVWVDRPGVDVSAADEKGKLKVTIAADAVPGLYWLRVYDAEGSASPQAFVVGTVPEVLEQEPNNETKSPQTLGTQAAVVNGRITPAGDVDVFAVTLTRGQTLVASLEAHETLASPCDAVLQVVSPRGIVLAENDDERGLDPQLTFTAPADGVYLVRAFAFPASPDTAIRLAGNEAYIYRLTITSGAFLDAAMPLALTRGATSPIEAFGWNIPDATKTRSLAPAVGAATVELFDPAWAGVYLVPVEPHATPVESEPNGPEKPQRVEPPCTISGRIGVPRDRDVFSFIATKGQAFLFQIESRSLGYPLDAVLDVSDAANQSLARIDDVGPNADAELIFTAPADGEFRLTVSDLYRHGGPRYHYRLRAVQLTGDFALSVETHALAISAGALLEIPIAVERRHGFADEITFNVEGLPAGVTQAQVKSLPGDDTAKAVKITLTATEGSRSARVRIIGQSSGTVPRTHAATAALAGRPARTAELWLTVK